MIFKKSYIAPSVKIKHLDPQSIMAGSGGDSNWEVSDEETVGGQGAKNGYFDDEETDNFSSSYFK